MVDFTTISLFLVMLTYVNMYDWYLLCLIPYALLVIGLYVKDRWHAYKFGMGLACLALLAGAALWARARLSLFEAYWKASDYLLEQGIPVSEISTQWEWTAYYEFDQYLAEINYRMEPNLGPFLEHWIPAQRRKAQYTTRMPCTAPGRILTAVPYQTMLLRTEYICAIEK